MTAPRQLLFPVSDLIIAPEAVCQAVLHTCRRTAPARVQTMLSFRDRVIITLTDSPCAPGDLRLHCLLNPSLEEVQATMQSRWQGGYDTVGMVSDESGNSTRVLLLVQKD